MNIRKTLYLFVLTLFGLLLNVAFTEPIQDDGNFAHLVVKARSEWGTLCEKCVEYQGYKRVYDKTYKVWMANTSDMNLDVKCCVQEEDKTWRCFFHNNMRPKDTLIAYACKGTGKYLRWAKKAGDSSMMFPTDDEINKDFKE